MQTAAEICRAIIASDFDVTELNQISQALLFQRNQLGRRNTGQLVLGTDVRWLSPRLGCVMSGKVVKVGRKFITVKTTRGDWRVPANLLERA
jgi:ribosomal protein L35AE/L33A